MLNIANDTGVAAGVPASRDEWARLAQTLGIKVIHVAERDTQVARMPKSADEFVNTWSVDGFVSEGAQPAELGWGTHEKHFPEDGARHGKGSGCAIYLKRPGASTRVRTWTPKAGHFHGFLITHSEAISLADYYTVLEGTVSDGTATGGTKAEDGRVLYRPTAHYAYHPSDDAVLSVHEFAGRNWHLQARKRIMCEEIIAGIDELGVLLAGHAKNAYWYGSQLSIGEARKLAPYNSATSLQVTAAALAGMIWAMENPNRGVVEPDDMDFERPLEICMPYLGTVAGHYTDWTPLYQRGELFAEDLDTSDPWQFKNVRVV
jgi:homospermidine synthase